MNHRTHVYVRSYRCQGRCECGWRGRWRPMKAEASDDAQMHKLSKRYEQ